MDTITVIFTKNVWNPISWFIRWVLPRSRFSLAISSHCYIVDGDTLYESTGIGGVQTLAKSSLTDQIVMTCNYTVKDRAAGIEFLKSQLGKPYDFMAVLALGIDPNRDWESTDKWYCYEYAAKAIKTANGPQFNNVSHITETGLIAAAD